MLGENQQRNPGIRQRPRPTTPKGEKRAQQSPGVTDTGSDVLKQRGNLTPEQIHKLAHKGKKAECHSDVVAEPEKAQLVQLNTLKAHGVVVNESGL